MNTTMTAAHGLTTGGCVRSRGTGSGGAARTGGDRIGRIGRRGDTARPAARAVSAQRLRTLLAGAGLPASVRVVSSTRYPHRYRIAGDGWQVVVEQLQQEVPVPSVGDLAGWYERFDRPRWMVLHDPRLTRIGAVAMRLRDADVGVHTAGPWLDVYVRDAVIGVVSQTDAPDVVRTVAVLLAEEIAADR